MEVFDLNGREQRTPNSDLSVPRNWLNGSETLSVRPSTTGDGDWKESKVFLKALQTVPASLGPFQAWGPSPFPTRICFRL